MKTDVAIIGGGPAGVAAAVQLTRGGIACMLFERDTIGGLLMDAGRVDNMPGHEPQPGPAICRALQAQLRHWNITVVQQEVLRLEPGFVLTTAQQSWKAERVIVATGTTPKKLEDTGNKQIYYSVSEVPRSISRLLVLGAGDVAFDYALTLASRQVRPTIVARSSPSALPLLQELARQRGIDIIEPSEAPSDIPMLIAIGRQQERTLLAPFEPLSVDGSTCLTSLTNLYLCGTVRGERWERHATIAAADGLRAATHIIEARLS